MPRWLDVLAAGAALVVLALPLLLIALAVASTSRGPALFRQARMGRDGRLFRVLKFRTMRCGGDGSGRLTLGDRDPRTTALGRVLRRYKLDELPQLVNVVRGDMAIVGPRPEVPEYRLPDCPEQDELLEHRPGLTDPASLRFRDEAELLAQQPDPDRYYRTCLLPAKAALSVEYLRRRTWRTDVAVIWATARAAVRPGAGTVRVTLPDGRQAAP